MRLVNYLKNKKVRAVCFISFSTIILLVLFFVNPAEYTYYPTCVFYSITGKLCPGCGGMRGMHQLLHGNIIEALKFNLLLAAVVPVGAYYLLSEFSVLFLDKPFPHLPHSKAVFYPVLFVVILYWILRNL